MFLFHFYIYFYLDASLKFGEKRHTSFFFQVGFFFNIYKFYFFLFFTLYLVSLVLEKKILLKLFHCISLSLFHLFPFLFHSFCVFTFFFVYVCFMFLFYSILILSIFIFFYFYVFIYVFIFFFLFQKYCSFFNMFYNENNFFFKLYFCLIKCRSPDFPQGFL